MTMIPNAFRVTPSDPVGNLSFTPSGGAVLYYEARAYASGTSTPVLATKYLGVPNADPITNLITVTIETMMNSLVALFGAGSYDVAVAAIGAGGTDESVHTASYTVPLQLP